MTTAKTAPKKTTSGAAKKLSAKEQKARDARVREELEAQVAAQAAEILELREQRRKAIENVNIAVQEELDNDNVRIERPTGSAGDGYVLREEMQLNDNVQLYKRIQRTVRRCVDKAGLDERKGIRGQDTIKLSKVYKAARELQPRLKRYVNDWATAEMVKMLLRNRRQYAARRARQESPELDIDIEALQLGMDDE